MSSIIQEVLNYIHSIIIPQSLDPMIVQYMCSQFANLFSILSNYSMHKVKQSNRIQCEVQVFVELVVCGDQAEAASDQFCFKSREEPGRRSCDHQHSVVQLAGSDLRGLDG